MTQSQRRNITRGLVLALTASCSALAWAGHSGGQTGSSEAYTADITAERMFVGNRGADPDTGAYRVDAYDRSGFLVLDLTGDGLNLPFGIDVDHGNVYVVSQNSDAIYAYLRKAHRGDPLGTVPQLDVLVPPGSGGLKKPFYSTVRDGELYVSSHDTDEVLRYDAETGAFIDVAIAAGAGGLDGPRGLDFDSKGRLYVASSLGNEVIVYNRRGKPIRHISGIPTPCGVSVSKYDEICVGSAGGDGVHCYNPQGKEIYSDTSGKVCGLDFGPHGELYTTRPDINAVTVHSLRPGTMGVWFTDAALPSGLSWGD